MIMRKYCRTPIIVPLSLALILAACDDDSGNLVCGEGTQETEGKCVAQGQVATALGILISCHEDDHCGIGGDETHQIIFCYAEEDCDPPSSGFWASWFSGSRLQRVSDPERVAVGVKVGLIVDSGAGSVQVLAGEHWQLGEFEHFNIHDILASESFDASQGSVTVLFELGQTD